MRTIMSTDATNTNDDGALIIARAVATELRQFGRRASVGILIVPHIFLVDGEEIKFFDGHCELLTTKVAAGMPYFESERYEYAKPTFPDDLIDRIRLQWLRGGDRPVNIEGEMPLQRTELPT